MQNDRGIVKLKQNEAGKLHKMRQYGKNIAYLFIL